MEQDKVKKSRRRFDQEFKVDAVRLVAESGKTVSEVARNLLIGRANWKVGRSSCRGRHHPWQHFPVTGTSVRRKRSSMNYAASLPGSRRSGKY